MRLTDILPEGLVVPDLRADNKESALNQLASLISKHDSAPGERDTLLQALIKRERLGSTGVGEGVAIPHAKIPGLNQLLACFARAPAGIPFESIDDVPVKLVFVLLVPESSAGAHLKALARISRLLKQPDLRERLLEQAAPDTIYEIFREADQGIP